MEKKYDHKQAEITARQLWEQKKIYVADQHKGPRYSIDTPPPTVSGALHIGHIFSYTQTDIIARYKRMNGFCVFYPFGFDDNGLPTERYVEKKKKVRPHELGRSAFIELTLKETHEAEEQFKQLWQSMGLSVDWNACYSTISENTRKISQESFIRLYKYGHVYRKEEPALYCTTCRTTVAQAELDSIESSTTFNQIAFRTTGGNELLIATTRPELLPSCVALLYHPEDTRYKKLLGEHAVVPLFDRTVPILADENVEPGKGTGLVMVCTFGDSTDVLWYKKHNLPYIQSIGLNGKFVESTGILAGLTVAKAREKVLEELNNTGLLRDQKKISHTVNVHERCGKEIEYTQLTQWFLHILKHKQTFIDLAEQINWHPSFMKSRYIDWVQHLAWDWCLSRQRFYGIPFPAWHCTKCKEIVLADIKDLPVDPQETPYKGTCPSCKGNSFEADTDVMDTWNTSSLTPYICTALEKPNAPLFEKNNDLLPMSMRPQAHDIIRTWAFYTIIKAWMHNGTIPWRDIVISGHVLSDSQEKLSKSKNQKMLSPEQLLESYSADVVRYWTATGTLGQDVAYSENQFKIGRRLTTKLWNAFIFTREHIAPVQATDAIPSDLGIINEWLLHNASKCFMGYKKYLDSYEFGRALDVIEQFFWHDFCDNYLELIKDQLFNPDNYSPEQIKATQWTLFNVGQRILQMYAPYLPFITEAIYSHVYKQKVGKESIHQTKFDELQKNYSFEQSTQDMHIILNIIEQVRKLKSEQQLSLKTPLTQLQIHSTNPQIITTIEYNSAILKGITHAQEIQTDTQVENKTELKKHNDALIAVITI